MNASSIHNYPIESMEIIKSNLHPEFLKIGSNGYDLNIVEIVLKVLVSSHKIIRVSIFIDIIKGHISKDICNNISNSKILKQSRLSIKNSSFNKEIIHSLIANSSIEKLSQKDTDLSREYDSIDTLIRENKFIRILNLTHCRIYRLTYLVPSIERIKLFKKLFY